MLTDHFLLSGFKSEKANFWFLLILSVVVLCAGLGLRDPWPVDEPRFALVAKQMVETGQWLFPFRGGEIYPDKPPLFMWLIALGYVVTGSMRVAFLLPSLFAGLGCLVLVYDIAKRLWNRETAFRATLFLLFTVQFTQQARYAQIDALVTFFITLGLYGFLRFLLLDGRWRWYYLGWFAAGLGIITKGVGILAVLVLIPAIWTHWEQLRHAPLKSWLKGLAGPLFLLLACGLWVVPMVLAVQHYQLPEYIAYRNNILFRQTVTRYANSWHHLKAPWYYLTSVIPAFWIPWSLLIPWFIWKAIHDFRERDQKVILMIGYLVLMLIFFSISAGKRGVYITPGTPFLALLAAYWLPGLLQRRWPRWLLGFQAWLLSLTCLGLGAALLIHPQIVAKLGDMQSPWMIWVSLGVLSCAANLAFRKQVLVCILTTLALIWVHYGFWGYGIINDLRTPQSIMRQIDQDIPQTDDIVLIHFKEQFLLFSHRPLFHYGYLADEKLEVKDTASWVQEKPNRWVLGPLSDLDACYYPAKGKSYGFRHGEMWYLVNAQALKPECASMPSLKLPIYFYKPSIYLAY